MSVWRRFSVLLLVFSLEMYAEEWADAFHQYRIPVLIHAPKAGPCRLAIDTARLTELVNAHETFRFREEAFAYPFLALSIGGRIVPGGYALHPGRELVANGDFSDVPESGVPTGWRPNAARATDLFAVKRTPQGNRLVTHGSSRYALAQKIAVSPRSWYHFRTRARGVSRPAVHFWPQDHDDTVPVPGGYEDSFRTAKEFLETSYAFRTCEQEKWRFPALDVQILNFDSETAFVSLRECSLVFTADLPAGGTLRAMLYYAPVEGARQCPPPVMDFRPPDAEAPVDFIGFAERHAPSRRLLVTGDAGTVWTDLTTEKILPGTLPPAEKAKGAWLHAARNEQETLQLVVTPVRRGRLVRVECEVEGIPPETIDVRRVEYVPVLRPSAYTGRWTVAGRSTLTGAMPDPMPLFRPFDLKPGENALLWITVHVPEECRPGVHSGQVRLCLDGETLVVSLAVEVFRFSLPKTPACRSMVAFSQYANQFLFPFHGAKSRHEKHLVSRAYLRELANFRLNSKNPCSAGVWNPDLPPKVPHKELT